MTRDEMLTRLHPARLPADMAMPDLREILALTAFGLLLGVALFLLLMPFLRFLPSRRDRILATRDLPTDERLLAIARILGHLPAALRPAAYGAEPAPPPDRIEAIARQSHRHP